MVGPPAAPDAAEHGYDRRLPAWCLGRSREAITDGAA